MLQRIYYQQETQRAALVTLNVDPIPFSAAKTHELILASSALAFLPSHYRIIGGKKSVHESDIKISCSHSVCSIKLSNWFEPVCFVQLKRGPTYCYLSYIMLQVPICCCFCPVFPLSACLINILKTLLLVTILK